MKKIYNYTILIFSLFVLISCEDFMEKHKEYIKDGEIIYSPKPDSVAFIAGKNRIMFRFWLYNSPNVKTVDVYWNDGLDSLITPVTPSTGLDSMDIIIPDLEEKSYTFNVNTTDKYGHKSLIETDFGTSYSINYQATLANRKLKSAEYGEDKIDGKISWFTAAENLIRTEVKFTNRDGEQVIAWTPDTLDVTICENAAPLSEYSYRTLFTPEAESIDTFSTAWSDPKKFPPADFAEYDRSTWNVLECSDETASDGGGMKTIIDNSLTTYWHSQYSPSNAPLPHWAIIDMTEEKAIYKITSYRRKGNTDAKTIVYYTSNDKNTWTEIGRFTYGGAGDKGDMIVDPDTNASGRYLKVSVEASNHANGCSSIAEIYVFDVDK